MSQSPFANPYDLPGTAMPERTSVMAVLSLVLGILCVPFFGILAIFLGVFALFGIKASRGRVSGTGLAVTGIILGVVMTLLWGTCVGGSIFIGDMMRTKVAPAVGTIITAAQGGDVEGVRKGMATGTQPRVTPEAVQAFSDTLTAEMGAYKGVPASLPDMVKRYGEVFEALGQSGSSAGGNPMQGYNNAMPIPLEFEKGWALVIVPINQQSQGGGGGPEDLIENIIVCTPSGAQIVLVPVGTFLPPATPSPDATTPDSPPPAPEPGASPDTDAPPAEPKEGGGG